MTSKSDDDKNCSSDNDDEDEDSNSDKDDEDENCSRASELYQSNIYQGDGADSVNTSTSEEMESNDESMEADPRQETDEEYETDVEDNDDDEEAVPDDDLEEEVWAEGNIPVIITARQHPNTAGRDRLQSALHHIQTNERVAISSELPTIAVTNFRSLGPRVHSVKDDILMRDIEVQICSETWEKLSNKK